MMKQQFKETALGAMGSVTGGASILGSWQVCHSVCLGLIALLGMLGITLAGMPLLFLTEIALPLWSLAVLLWAVSLGLYLRKGCVSKNLLLLNAGLIIAGTPFPSVQEFSLGFWTVGGLLGGTSLFLFTREKLRRTHP